MLMHRLKRIASGAPAPSNTGFGVFGGARTTDASSSAVSHKYDFVTASTSTTTSLTSNVTGSATGSSNTTYGIVNSAYINGAVTSRFTIATMSVAAGALLALSYDSIFAGSVSSSAYWMGGNQSGNVQTAVRKYNYSADSWSTLGTSCSAQHRGASHNNSTYMFALSGGTTNTGITNAVQKFAFSSETFETATSISIGRSLFNGAGGNQEKAIILGGSSTWADTYALSTEKILFADNSKTATQSLGTGEGRRSFNTASNDSHGIWAGGLRSGTPLSSTVDFTFSTDTHVAGTSLTAAAIGAGAFSSSQIR